MPSTTSADGTVIDFDQLGDGPAVVLICAGPTDRNSNGELAGLLAASCTVLNYDRRGRGQSGDTAPYSVQREIEDLDAVITAAGGSAAVFGNSGGAFLAVQAVATGLPITKLAFWEPPYIIEGTRPAVPADYREQQEKLLAEGRHGDMVELFLTKAVGMPAEVVAGMRQAPFWPYMEPTAPALVYDAIVAGDFSIPDEVSSIDVPTVVLDGGTTPWLTTSADAVAAKLPNAQRQTLAGQQHNVEAAALAPAVATFVTAG
ncbi:MAG TPA: alpha/beta hydrolase [Jatrophihabitantaceae bacterium]|nr:alpha/beta hydrolase [Jatrophihabitantaceae bacterium]